jgi:hypothetical protein
MGNRFTVSDHFLIPERTGRIGNNDPLLLHEGPPPRSVKQEPHSPHTPELYSTNSAALQQYQFQFRAQPHSGRSGGLLQQAPSSGPNRTLYHFGSESPLMSNSWPSSSASSVVANPNVDLASMQHTMSFNEYEDAADELTELPALPGRPSTNLSHEKTIRRRSSKGPSFR